MKQKEKEEWESTDSFLASMSWAKKGKKSMDVNCCCDVEACELIINTGVYLTKTVYSDNCNGRVEIDANKRK